MTQYLRKVRAIFNGMTVNPSDRVEVRDELVVEFNVSKSIAGDANTAEIKIYNLTEGHRNALGKELDRVELQAGYRPPFGSGPFGTIFKGDIRDVQHTREDMDIVSIIECGDGDRSFRKATTSKAFPKNTPVKDVLEHVAQELEKRGLSRGEWKLPDDLPTLKRPYAICSACTREMNRLGRGYGFYWSSQDETIEVVAGDKALSKMVTISPTSSVAALVNVPTITDNGVKVSCLLNPDLRPGHKVQIESSVLEMNAANGIYRIAALTFQGNNRDGDMIADIDGERIDGGGKVDEGRKE